MPSGLFILKKNQKKPHITNSIYSKTLNDDIFKPIGDAVKTQIILPGNKIGRKHYQRQQEIS